MSLPSLVFVFILLGLLYFPFRHIENNARAVVCAVSLSISIANILYIWNRDDIVSNIFLKVVLILGFCICFIVLPLLSELKAVFNELIYGSKELYVNDILPSCVEDLRGVLDELDKATQRPRIMNCLKDTTIFLEYTELTSFCNHITNLFMGLISDYKELISVKSYAEYYKYLDGCLSHLESLEDILSSDNLSSEEIIMRFKEVHYVLFAVVNATELFIDNFHHWMTNLNELESDDTLV